MFKNATILKITQAPAQWASLEYAIQTQTFAPCGPTQEKSSGWVPPRGEDNGLLVEAVDGHMILKLMTETKSVPSDVLKREVDKACKAIEATTGRKPGKKERREIADVARITLLPNAFSKQATTLVWIDAKGKTLVVDSASQARVDDATMAITCITDEFVIQQINTKASPAAAMSHWLSTHEAPQCFSVDRECELKAADESKAVVRYTRHALDTDEVAQHIAMGKVPTRVAMTWNDRVSFVLTDALQLKKLTFLDVVFEGENSKGSKEDDFDADVAIFTGEMQKLIPDLIDALGGELQA